jgi:hypothetical protein
MDISYHVISGKKLLVLDFKYSLQAGIAQGIFGKKLNA